MASVTFMYCTLDYYSLSEQTVRWGRKKLEPMEQMPDPVIFSRRDASAPLPPHRVKGPPQSSPHSNILASFLHPRHFITTYTTYSP